MHFCFSITVVVAILTHGPFSLGVCPPHPPGLRGVNIESLMSCHLLLHLLHELANIISFFPTNVINLVINDNEIEILFIT